MHFMRQELGAALILLAALIGNVEEAAAQRTRQQSGSWENSRGKGGTWSREANTQRGRREVQAGAVDASGRTASRQRSVERTGKDSAKVESSTTGWGGRTRSTEGNLNRTAPGEGTLDATRTRPSGETVEAQGDWKRTGNDTTSSGTYTTSGGGSGTWQRDVTRDSGVAVVNSSATNAQGQTVSSVSTRTANDGVISGTKTVTGPKGKSKTRSGSASVKP